MKFIDLTGQKFANFTVIHNLPSRKKVTMWLCKCDCGTEKEVSGHALKNGQKSCGCSHLIHGDNRRLYKAKEYMAWKNAKERCYLITSRSYKDYGERGIMMCEEWRSSYEKFLQDMGRCPSKELTLDRINNDGPYAPGNCRWATRSQQRRNQRKAHRHSRQNHF